MLEQLQAYLQSQGQGETQPDNEGSWPMRNSQPFPRYNCHNVNNLNMTGGLYFVVQQLAPELLLSLAPTSVGTTSCSSNF